MRLMQQEMQLSMQKNRYQANLLDDIHVMSWFGTSMGKLVTGIKLLNNYSAFQLKIELEPMLMVPLRKCFHACG